MKEESSMKNMYLQQVQQEAEVLEDQLRARRAKKKIAPAPNMPMAQQAAAPAGGGGSPGNNREGNSNNNLGVRITGWWRWKTVVVPPNVYVVHTRRGHKEPLHIGMGISFKYKPHLDSFLIIPSSMQTILINANSICKELQGILIQAYVQWIIDDIELAYKSLDFSDIDDPMSMVNLQLKEQAEAAIKDKVSTMSIKEVLSDKQPIIEELTKRLKAVAEGTSEGQGLGIRIITVQIKEAVVSSANLWENLQKPYRASQKTAARLAEIENDAMISKREMEERQKQAKEELETEAEISRLQGQKESEEFDREEEESLRRHKVQQETHRKRQVEEKETARQEVEAEQKLKERRLELASEMKLKEKERDFEEQKREMELELEAHKLEQEKLQSQLQIEMARIEQKTQIKAKELEASKELKGKELEARLARERQELALQNEQRQKELELEKMEKEIENNVSHQLVQLRAAEILPELAATLPQPESLQSITIGSDSSQATGLPGLMASLLGVMKNYGIDLAGGEKEEKGKEPSPQKASGNEGDQSGNSNLIQP